MDENEDQELEKIIATDPTLADLVHHLNQIRESQEVIGAMIEAGQRREIQHTTGIIAAINAMIDSNNLMIKSHAALAEIIKSALKGE